MLGPHHLGDLQDGGVGVEVPDAAAGVELAAELEAEHAVDRPGHRGVGAGHVAVGQAGEPGRGEQDGHPAGLRHRRQSGPVGAGVEAGVVAVDVGAGHERPAGHRLGAAQRRGRDRQHLGTGGRVERRAVAGVHVDCGD